MQDLKIQEVKNQVVASQLGGKNFKEQAQANKRNINIENFHSMKS